MKKINFTLAAMAAAVCFGFSACETIDMDRSVLGEDEPELIENGDMEITFNCSMAEVEDGTKTEFHDNTIWWSIGDKIRFFQRYIKTAGSGYATGYINGTTGSQESYSPVLSFSTPVEYPAYYWALYPEEAIVSSRTSFTGETTYYACITVPAEQNPTLTSFDPKADVLVSEFITSDEKKTEFNMQFRRVVALGKMTIKNLPSSSNIKSVKIENPTYYFAGNGYFGLDLTDYHGVAKGTGSTSLILNYTTPVTAESSTGMTAYFTCLPCTLEEGKSFTVTVTTEAGEIFAKNVTIPAGRELVFEEGRGTRFSVDMSTAEKTSEWFTLDKSSSANTIDKVYCGLSKDSDFTGTMSSIKFAVVKKDNYDPSADYLSTSGSFVSDSGLSKFNSGETVNLSGSSLTIDTEYVFIVKCTTSDGKTCQITRTERTDWWKLALVGRSAGGVQIQITGIGLSTQTRNYRVVETSVLPDNAEGIEEYYIKTLAPGGMPTSYLDGINGNNGTSAYPIGITSYYTDKTNTAAMVAGTSYTVMIKATNTRGETEFKYASANAK